MDKFLTIWPWSQFSSQFSFICGLWVLYTVYIKNYVYFDWLGVSSEVWRVVSIAALWLPLSTVKTCCAGPRLFVLWLSLYLRHLLFYLAIPRMTDTFEVGIVFPLRSEPEILPTPLLRRSVGKWLSLSPRFILICFNFYVFNQSTIQ